MINKALDRHATLVALADTALLYFVIDNFQRYTLPAMACLELIIGPVQFLSALFLFLRKPSAQSWLYFYLILATILIGALITLIYSNTNGNLQTYLAPILIISYLVAHFFLYVVYRVKATQN